MRSTQLFPACFDKDSSIYGWATKHDQSGILLLEVLISLLIFSFAILGLVALQARAVQFSVDAEDRNRAALLANEMVSTMWGQKTINASEIPGEVSAWQSKIQLTEKSGLPNSSGTISAPDANGVVTITINWAPVGASGEPRVYMTQVAMP
ncbi:MAG TPA: hypothetical protein PKD66_03200 [Azonexus sp.]|nr:hypothetical protein [Azonexus sp.]